MSELKLLPCPFCGGEAELIRCGTGRQSAQVSCTQCNCHHESSCQGLRSGDAWNTRSPPELPPVSPEDLVEGEWYVVQNSSGEDHVVSCVIYPDEGPGLYALDVCFEAGWNLKNVPIYGPLRFKIGGAE